MKSGALREFRRCLGCGRYIWTVEQADERDNIAQRLRYCRECMDQKLNKPVTLSQIERENSEMSEAEKQKENTQEEIERYHDKRRFTAS